MTELYDPLFKKVAKKPSKEAASITEDARSLEELALTPPAGTALRRLFIGGKGENIPILFDSSTRTAYPIKE